MEEHPWPFSALPPTWRSQNQNSNQTTIKDYCCRIDSLTDRLVSRSIRRSNDSISCATLFVFRSFAKNNTSIADKISSVPTIVSHKTLKFATGFFSKRELNG